MLCVVLGGWRGQENPFTLIQTSKFYEVQKYLAVTRHVFNPQALIVGKKFWDGLSAEEKKRHAGHRVLADRAREDA